MGPSFGMTRPVFVFVWVGVSLCICTTGVLPPSTGVVDGPFGGGTTYRHTTTVFDCVFSTRPLCASWGGWAGVPGEVDEDSPALRYEELKRKVWTPYRRPSHLRPEGHRVRDQPDWSTGVVSAEHPRFQEVEGHPRRRTPSPFGRVYTLRPYEAEVTGRGSLGERNSRLRSRSFGSLLSFFFSLRPDSWS